MSKKSQKIPKIYSCLFCNINTSNKKDYTKHLNTGKHQKNINCNNSNNSCNIKIPNIKLYTCVHCTKNYNSRVGLWRHKKECVNNKNYINETIKMDSSSLSSSSSLSPSSSSSTNDIKALTNLVLELVKSNQDLQHQMVEVCKNSNNNTNISNSHNNNHNKTFNLQVFLNEDCKDAMNLSDFVNSLQLQLSDLDNMGKLGYTEGISKIIISEMNDLEQTKRPVHCSDIKRETLYVKDEDKWEKEQPNHPKLNKAIRKIEQKNFGLMGEWQAEHPTYKESTSEENNEFIKLISQTVSGTPDNINKVIKKIAKEVIIDK